MTTTKPTAKQPAARPDGRSTREVLLHTAERLFAERGIDAVSLREIGERAGQRNTAAVHYHFGDKDGLVRAILEVRLRDLNTRRTAMLDRLDDDEHDVRPIAACIVQPLVAELDSDNSYIGMLARAQLDRQRHRLVRSLDRPEIESYYSARELLCRSLEPLPRAVVVHRTERMLQFCIVTLAERQAAERAGDRLSLTRAEFEREMLAMAIALLTAPCSYP